MLFSFLFIFNHFYLALISFYVSLSTYFISASHQSNISNFHLSFLSLSFSSNIYILFYFSFILKIKMFSLSGLL